MKERILNKIIHFCMRRINTLYYPYYAIALIGTKEAKTMVRELEKQLIFDKLDFEFYEANILEYYKKKIDPKNPF